jgi:hypothetical protein
MRLLAAPLAVALALTPVVSCSFVAIKRAPAALAEGDVPDCTDGYGIPAVDGVAAVLLGVTAVSLHSAAESNADFRPTAWVATGATMLALISAAYGSHQVRRCRRQLDSIASKPALRAPEVPGALGSTCADDKECAGALVCDDTMHTCIPLEGETAPDPLETGAGEP